MLLVREVPVRDGCERAPEVKRTGRARSEANPHHELNLQRPASSQDI
jgi:hypothetical protein